MKKEIHPANYRQVIFQDVTSGEMFLIGSTVKSSEKAYAKRPLVPRPFL
jgi:ribosomal protein L31